MNFSLPPELNQLEDSLGRLLAGVYSFEQRRALVAAGPGWNAAVWKQLAELGVTGLGIPEAYGGFDAGSVAHLPVMRAAGRALWLEPYLGSVVLAGTALREAATPAQKDRWLPRIAAGEARLAWAHDEAPAGAQARAVRADGAWQLHGTKTTVLHGATATGFVVSASLGDGPDGGASALFLLDPASPGVAVRGYRLVDDTPAADLVLAGAAAQRIGADDDDGTHAASAIDATLDAGTAAVCADMLGTMELAFELTCAYVNTRKQFGRVIADYQALRHRVADMAVSLELARSMACAAAAAPQASANEDNRDDLARAKLVIGRHARSLCHSAIQLHGGVGMTEEYAVGHCLRRVHVLDQLFGDADAHLAVLAGLRPGRQNSKRNMQKEMST